MFKSIIAGVVLGVASMSVNAQSVTNDTPHMYAGVVTCGELLYNEEDSMAIVGYALGVIDQINLIRYSANQRQLKVPMGRLFGELFDQCVDNEELPLIIAVQRTYAKLISI